MRGSNVLGIIFSNSHDNLLREMTGDRAMGSVPFGGRYRLIDFPLSNMVNAGMRKVGVITKSNYQSLMDHIGSGKPWDLARKKGGLFILPPYGRGSTGGMYSGSINALNNTMQFLTMATEEYILLCNSDLVATLDFSKLFEQHTNSGADVTICTSYGRRPEGENDITVVNAGEDGRITDMQVSPENSRNDDVEYSLGVTIMRRDLLIKWIRSAASRNYSNISSHIFLKKYKDHAFYTHRVNTYCMVIDSMNSYLSTNMELLKPDVLNSLFFTGRPVYTKIRDTMPVRYGLNAIVNNSLVADGCYIDGTLDNCIIFRDVHIERGAVLKNCIVMQGSRIERDVHMEFAMLDKNAHIKDGHTFIGFETYPVYISKGSEV